MSFSTDGHNDGLNNSDQDFRHARIRMGGVTAAQAKAMIPGFVSEARKETREALDDHGSGLYQDELRGLTESERTRAINAYVHSYGEGLRKRLENYLDDRLEAAEPDDSKSGGRKTGGILRALRGRR